jgi:hypothetical protein
LVTELAESGAGEVIMSIAGHVSRAMLSRYSHVRMEATRRALDEIAARQRAADEKRKNEAERQQQAAPVSQPVLVQ